MVKFLIKLLVTFLVFFFIFESVDVRAAADAVTLADHNLLIFAFILQFFSTVLAAFRWRLMMRALHYEQGSSFFLKSYLKASFFNQALPTSIGGDAVRAIDLSQTGYSKKESVYSVLVDRLIGVFGLLLLNLLAIATGSERFPVQIITVITVTVVFLMSGAAVLFYVGELSFLSHISILKYLHEISLRIRAVFSTGARASQQVILCLFVHLLSVGAIYFLGKGVGLPYDFIIYLVLIPPVFLLTLIPISLAGWGVREGGMIGLFLFINADKTMVLAVSLLYGMSLIVTSLPGAFFYLSAKKKNL